MKITVVTKSMGKRAFDAVDSINVSGTGIPEMHLVIKYYTQYTHYETAKIPMNDVVGFYYGQINNN